MGCVHAPLVSENLLYAEWVIHSLRCNTVHMSAHKGTYVKPGNRTAVRRSDPIEKYRETWAKMDHTRRGDINAGLTQIMDETRETRRSATSWYLALASDPEHQEFERAVRRRRRSSVDD